MEPLQISSRRTMMIARMLRLNVSACDFDVVPIA